MCYSTGYSTGNFFTGRLSRFVLYSEAREASRPLTSTLWLGLRGSSQCESDCESLCFTSNLHTRRPKEWLNAEHGTGFEWPCSFSACVLADLARAHFHDRRPIAVRTGQCHDGNAQLLPAHHHTQQRVGKPGAPVRATSHDHTVHLATSRCLALAAISHRYTTTAVADLAYACRWIHSMSAARSGVAARASCLRRAAQSCKHKRDDERARESQPACRPRSVPRAAREPHRAT